MLAGLLTLIASALPAQAEGPRITIEFRDNRGDFAYDVYKDGEWQEMDYYGRQLERLVKEDEQARRFARDLADDREEGRQGRIFGHVLLWGSVLGTIVAASSESTGGTLLGVAGMVGGIVVASNGKSKGRKAYRYLFRAVNTYNESMAVRGAVPSGPAVGQPGTPDCSCGEGTFPPGGAGNP